MERAFIIKNQEFIDQDKKHDLMEEKWHDAIMAIYKEMGLKKSRYYTSSDRLRIPFENREERKPFKPFLMAGDDSAFKKSSIWNKRLNELLKEKGYEFTRAPNAAWDNGMHFNGRFSYRHFCIDEVYYGYINARHDFELAESLEEIKMSEYHKIIEDYNEKIAKKREE